MPEPERTDRVSVYVRLSIAADQAIDERAAKLGDLTRSAVVEQAIALFVTETVARGSTYTAHPMRGETVLRKFKIKQRYYDMLARAQETDGHSFQDMLRHAVGYLTGVY